jgi:uroporphyrinogen decarboxylase
MALHICGYIDPMMEDVLETGIDLISLDAPSSLQKIRELADGRLVIMGNVQTSLFASGTEQEMQDAVGQCVETAAEGSGYILASGCEIPLDSAEDRIELFFDYGRRFGRRFMSELSHRQPGSNP